MAPETKLSDIDRDVWSPSIYGDWQNTLFLFFRWAVKTDHAADTKKRKCTCLQNFLPLWRPEQEGSFGGGLQCEDLIHQWHDSRSIFYWGILQLPQETNSSEALLSERCCGAWSATSRVCLFVCLSISVSLSLSLCLPPLVSDTVQRCVRFALYHVCGWVFFSVQKCYGLPLMLFLCFSFVSSHLSVAPSL